MDFHHCCGGSSTVSVFTGFNVDGRLRDLLLFGNDVASIVQANCAKCHIHLHSRTKARRACSGYLLPGCETLDRGHDGGNDVRSSDRRAKLVLWFCCGDWCVTTQSRVLAPELALTVLILLTICAALCTGTLVASYFTFTMVVFWLGDATKVFFICIFRCCECHHFRLRCALLYPLFVLRAYCLSTGTRSSSAGDDPSILRLSRDMAPFFQCHAHASSNLRE